MGIAVWSDMHEVLKAARRQMQLGRSVLVVWRPGFGDGVEALCSWGEILNCEWELLARWDTEDVTPFAEVLVSGEGWEDSAILVFGVGAIGGEGFPGPGGELEPLGVVGPELKELLVRWDAQRTRPGGSRTRFYPVPVREGPSFEEFVRSEGRGDRAR